MPDKFVTDPANIVGARIRADENDFSSEISWNDSKIKYVTDKIRGKSVLDLGCVSHDPNTYRSKYWLHKAISESASSVVGMDLSQSGVEFLTQRNFKVIMGDVQNFNLDTKFDVIVAGDLIEHLENFSGFLQSCKNNLKTSGELIITTPNPWYWRNIVKAIISTEVKNNEEHTCWLCPRTLRQLASRHGYNLYDIKFGSRYKRDLWAPLPRGVKHTTWFASLNLK